MTKTPVEDKDLVHLRKIPNLKTLDLRGTHVTDDGLDNLAAIDSLEFVTLQQSGVSPEGVERLRKALPKAEITR